MTPTAPDASTEAATSDLSGKAGENALKASAENLPPKQSDNFSVSSEDTPATPAHKTKAAPKSHPKAQTFSGNDTDDVYVSKLALDERFPRKSLSVVHLQRRLGELGYAEASADVQGNAGLLTKSSVAQWQTDNKFPVGPITREQATALFKGDKAVNLVLDTIG